MTTSLVACMELSSEDEEASNLSSQEQQSCIHDDLAKLKRLHNRYRDIHAALADGFKLGVIVAGNPNPIVTGCVKHPIDPTKFGAMGYHYFRQKRFDDAEIKELKPEALVYHPGDNGRLKLGAVEWVVPKAAWEAEHGVGAAPPEVYGHALTVINPDLNWYVGHTWLWKENPSGVFSDWNPNVTCP